MNVRFARHRAGRAALLSAAVLFAASGCESVSVATDAVRERWAARHEGQVRTFAAPPRKTYEALRQAAVQLGYRIVRGGPAQGELEAVSPVRSGETHGSARQLLMKVRLRGTLDGAGTEATVHLREVIEPDSSQRAGQAVEVPLRDAPQYQVLFERLGQVLAATPAAGEEKSR